MATEIAASDLAPGLEICRVVTGLWQVADMERRRRACSIPTVRHRSSPPMPAAGFDSFDMADHYGSAEIIAGRYLAGARSGALPAGRPARRGPSRNGARRPGR